MPRVRLPDWADQLSDSVNEIETRAKLDDPRAVDEARNMLRTLRSYEVRVRQIALHTDHLDPHARFSLPKRW